MKPWKRVLRDFLIVLALAGVDQWTKYLARTAFSDGSSYTVLDGVLRLVFHKNTGAVWGILSGKTVFVTALSVLCLATVLYIYWKTPLDKKYRYMRIFLVMIVAGAIGNIIDRFAFGYVTDFIYFELIDFPVFNLADCYLTLSELGLIFSCLFYYRGDSLDYIFMSKKARLKKAEAEAVAQEEATKNAD